MAPSVRDYLKIRTARPSGFSPTSERVLVGADLSGTMQLYDVARTGGALRQLTHLAEPVGGRYLPDCDDVLLSFDHGGDERLQVHRLAAGSGHLAPVVADRGHIARAGGVSRDGRLLAYTSNRRTGADFDVWARDLRTGRERMVFSPG
ncbi:MAG TPA: hypothetical protein VGR26_14180, partial [Acidimicrobiales bacterium]|nr:hypothetical protein [Acidimicrobiales bacterium]